MGGLAVQTLLTERPRHAADLAAALGSSVERIYVFGGDGAFNEVVNGVEENVAVGFLPGGGTSVLLARSGSRETPSRVPGCSRTRIASGASRSGP